MAYPPDYKYFTASEKQYVKNSGCTCIGAIIVVIFLGFVAALPGILGGNVVFMGDAFSYIFMLTWMLGPLVLLGLLIRAYSGHREKKEHEKMLAASEE